MTPLSHEIPFLVHSYPPLLDKIWGVHGWWKKCLMQGCVMGPMYDLNARNMLCKNWCLGTFFQGLLMSRLLHIFIEVLKMVWEVGDSLVVDK